MLSLTFSRKYIYLAFLTIAMVALLGCPPPTPGGPTAEFRADVTSGPAPLTVQFTDLSTPGDSPITQWTWLFGDGENDGVQNPTHAYAAAGSYNVSLTVTTANGEDTKLKLNFVSVTGEGEGEGEVHLGEMVSVPAGTFTMGCTDSGDDAEYGLSWELPRHQVTLSAYQIGKYAVTNAEYADILNWALARGYLSNSSSGEPYDGGDVYAVGQVLLSGPPHSQITYSGTRFSSKHRTGLPGTTTYSMALHPVVGVWWCGAAMYCNWLSESQGLTPCYDTSNWTCNFAANGYHLPTEAQWERAAAWDTASNKHWIYGFMSDTLSGKSRCNYSDVDSDCVNPLGLTDRPYTSPVGWFNGVNVSPNGSIPTENSPSPVGCYDMSGNVWQWCNDWSGSYPSEAVTDPQGPSWGVHRMLRGGLWGADRQYCRSASRCNNDTVGWLSSRGFRVARNP